MAYVAKGYYLEEFEIGKCYESVGRTITEADVVNFAGISGDFNPLHMDDEFAKNNMFGKRVAHGALGLIVSTVCPTRWVFLREPRLRSWS